MKNFLIPLLFLITSCATTQQASDTITLPVAKNKKEVNGIKQAVKTKYKITEKQGNVFDFYYGPKGSYYVVVTNKDGSLIDLSNYDISLEINSSTNDSPEVLSMALEDKQVLSGFGEVREGPTGFNLIFNSTDPSINKSFKLNFMLNIQLFL